METFLNYTSLLSFGTKWFEFIVDVTVKGTIILILAYFVNLVWRHASAAARNLVWNLAVVSLLIVPLFSLVLPEWEVSLFSYNRAEKQYFHADNAPSSLFNEQQTENLTNNEESTGNLSTITKPLSDDLQNSSVIARAGLFIKNTLYNVHWSVWLLLLWVIGALFVFARLMVGYTVMRRITKHFIPVNNHTLNSKAADYANQTGIKRTIQLFRCNKIAVPMTRGWLKPKIILPEEALSWSEKRRKSVLLHELAHVKRLDYLSSFVVHAVSVLYWFNPLVWIAVRKLCVECEKACDDLVLEAGTKASDYANHLVEVARSLISSKWAPSLEVAMARKSTFEGRLLAIFNDKSPRNNIKLSNFLTVGLPAVFLLTLLVCVQPKIQNISGMEPLTDVLTLELSFGAEETIENEDYLLARPMDLAINDAGNILVIDEDRIKVFDPNGKPVEILGRPGPGPGEFNDVHSIWISTSGYYCVFGGGVGFTAHFFRPDNSFIKRRNFLMEAPFKEIMKAKNLRHSRPEIVFILEEDVLLYSMDTSNLDRNKEDETEVMLFYETPDTLMVIASYPQSKNINFKGGLFGGLVMPSLGHLYIATLPGNRIVYSHSYHDTKKTENGYTYMLTLLSLETMEKTYITYPYIPTEIQWEPLSYTEEYLKENPDKRAEFKEPNRIIKDFLDKRKYNASLSNIITDGDLIFAFTCEIQDSTNILADVFDSRSGQHVSSAYFSTMPEYIKNGILYGFNNFRQSGDFARIQKYRIDPAVYGK